MAAGRTLLPRRTTEVKYDGEEDTEILEDEWDAEEGATQLDRKWTGRTTFYTNEDKGSNDLPTKVTSATFSMTTRPRCR